MAPHKSWKWTRSYSSIRFLNKRNASSTGTISGNPIYLDRVCILLKNSAGSAREPYRGSFSLPSCWPRAKYWWAWCPFLLKRVVNSSATRLAPPPVRSALLMYAIFNDIYFREVGCVFYSWKRILEALNKGFWFFGYIFTFWFYFYHLHKFNNIKKQNELFKWILRMKLWKKKKKILFNYKNNLSDKNDLTKSSILKFLLPKYIY